MIIPILALTDNYIWCLIKGGDCIIVDPGESQPVIEVLKRKNLNLIGILLTHHHYDHTNGVSELLTVKHVPVYGPIVIPQVTHPVHNQVSIDSFQFEIITVPGHTLEHVAYYSPGIVFTGDTLFTGGAGKIFEGTVDQMYQSLSKLRALPDDTLIYCGHEYTENNLYFAETVEPNNNDIQTRLKETKTLRQKGLPSVPALLLTEKKTNPFFRCQEKEVIVAASNYAKTTLTTPVQVLKVLREWKNSFRVDSKKC